MKSDKFYDAISDIDDDLIEEAEGKMPSAKKNMFKGLLALAACIALFVLLSFPLSNFFQKSAPFANKFDSAETESIVGATNSAATNDSSGISSSAGDKSSSSATTADSSTESIKQNPYFNATVLEVNDTSVLVEPLEGFDERNSSDKIEVSLKVVSTHPVPEMKKGDKIRIVYNGDIAETYPAQINTPFAIYALDSDGNVLSATPTTEKATTEKTK